MSGYCRTLEKFHAHRMMNHVTRILCRFDGNESRLYFKMFFFCSLFDISSLNNVGNIYGWHYQKVKISNSMAIAIFCPRDYCFLFSLLSNVTFFYCSFTLTNLWCPSGFTALLYFSIIFFNTFFYYELNITFILSVWIKRQLPIFIKNLLSFY